MIRNYKSEGKSPSLLSYRSIAVICFSAKHMLYCKKILSRGQFYDIKTEKYLRLQSGRL